MNPTTDMNKPEDVQQADVAAGSSSAAASVSPPPPLLSSSLSSATPGPCVAPTPPQPGLLAGRSILVTGGGADKPVHCDPTTPHDLVANSPPSPPSAGGAAGLHLHTQLDYGRVFSAYGATVRSEGEAVEVVAKVAHSSPGVREEVAWEAWLYTCRDLGAVPRFHGLFTGEGRVVVVLEHAGVEAGVGAMSAEQKLAIIAAYAALHAAGVVHRTAKAKHWLVLPTGEMRLIDFGDSAALEAQDVPSWAPSGRVLSREFFDAIAADEMTRVQRALGM